METNGTLQNILETTRIVQVRARLTPTLTHVVTYELVTSGAEDDTMSLTLHLFENQRQNPAQRPHECMLWRQFQLILGAHYACSHC